VQSLRLHCTYTDPSPPTACLLCNDFHFDDVTSAAEFTPFAATNDTQPALYLGFDRPFANRPALLYAQVEPQPYDANIVRDTSPASPQVVWEYAALPAQPQALCRWQRLEAQDETHTFAVRGLIAFVGPPDMARHAECGRELYWLRARLESGAFPAPPCLRRLLTNTVWASQATTRHNEELGSSDGSPNQTFRTYQAPVLLGQQIEVREPEAPAPDEQMALVTLEGMDAITPIVDVAGQVQGAWVRWHAMPDFYTSGPRDRHYLFDHLSGEVRFGNGQHGMIPPQGRGNIRAARYRTGGGRQGNRPAGSITQLKSALAYIDSVTNLEPAGGGADQESLARAKEHGPHRLRHNGRSVAGQDYEDLALEATPEVARALAITPRFNPLDLPWIDRGSRPATAPIHPRAGQVEVIIVPRSDAPQPIPSLALIAQVEAYLLARCSPTVTLHVAGPAWMQVTVTATVVPTSLDTADALTATVAAALRRFLHPLTGGADGRGWAFGRQPHLSTLYALIEALPGVDHVPALAVTETPRFDELTANECARLLIYAGDHVINLAALGEGG
jgi:predicted phage baseplate assembly protein